MKKLLLAITMTFFFADAAFAHGPAAHPQIPPWQDASPWPDRIVVTTPETPQTSFAVTWRSDSSVSETYAEIVEATDDARFDHLSRPVGATTEALDLSSVVVGTDEYPILWNSGLEPVHYHSVIFRGLKPDTMYAYRVRGAPGAWSEWYQVRTASETGPVKFIYVGDAQNGVLSHWSRLIRAAFVAAPDAKFILHAGDLVNRGSRDIEWAEWFKAVGFIHGMIPAIPVAGNHEYDEFSARGVKTDRLLSILWRPQFTLPLEEGLSPDLQEAVYDIRYSDSLHIFVLSTQNTKTSEQAAWLDQALASSDAKWKIVTMHHPIFSSGNERDSPERRDILLPVINKHKVDLVLQGHDHTYARGAIAQTPERLGTTDESGAVATMFVNSVSGPKQYEFKETGWDSYAKTGVALSRKAENTQFFQVITVDGETLTYEARTALGMLYDDFVMTKNAGGAKTITRGPTSTMDERMFKSTGPYEGVGDLK